jgi:hypothetical protein
MIPRPNINLKLWSRRTNRHHVFPVAKNLRFGIPLRVNAIFRHFFYSLIFDFTTILAVIGLTYQQQQEFSAIVGCESANQESEIDLEKKKDGIWIIFPSSFFLLPSSFFLLPSSSFFARLPLRVLRSLASFPQTVLFAFFCPRVASQIALSLQRLAIVRV